MSTQNNMTAQIHQIETAHVGYQVAVSLWSHAGNEVWTRFNMMLVANSIIIAVIGIALSAQRNLNLLTASMSATGIALCIAWYLITKRGFAYQVYYLFSAREIEEQYLSNTIHTMSRGGPFGYGKPINLTIDNKPMTFQMDRTSRLLSAQKGAYLTVLVFVVIYGVLLVQTFI
jgi:hypothetical protein